MGIHFDLSNLFSAIYHKQTAIHIVESNVYQDIVYNSKTGKDLKDQHKETSYMKDVEIVYGVAPCLILFKMMMKAYYLLSWEVLNLDKLQELIGFHHPHT